MPGILTLLQGQRYQQTRHYGAFVPQRTRTIMRRPPQRNFTRLTNRHLQQSVDTNVEVVRLQMILTGIIWQFRRFISMDTRNRLGIQLINNNRGPFLIMTHFDGHHDLTTNNMMGTRNTINRTTTFTSINRHNRSQHKTKTKGTIFKAGTQRRTNLFRRSVINRHFRNMNHKRIFKVRRIFRRQSQQRTTISSPVNPQPLQLSRFQHRRPHAPSE